MERCKETGHKPHPARFPIQLPLFFLRFLTDEGDLVLDPFAGSNTTGEACEELSWKWLPVERNTDYLEASRFRFEPHEALAEPAVESDTSAPARKRGRPRKGNSSANGNMLLFE
jgi:DNA modification methylase